MNPLILVGGGIIFLLGMFVLLIVVGGDQRQVSDDYDEMEELDYAPSNGEGFWREE